MRFAVFSVIYYTLFTLHVWNICIFCSLMWGFDFNQIWHECLFKNFLLWRSQNHEYLKFISSRFSKFIPSFPTVQSFNPMIKVISKKCWVTVRSPNFIKLKVSFCLIKHYHAQWSEGVTKPFWSYSKIVTAWDFLLSFGYIMIK